MAKISSYRPRSFPARRLLVTTAAMLIGGCATQRPTETKAPAQPTREQAQRQLTSALDGYNRALTAGQPDSVTYGLDVQNLKRLDAVPVQFQDKSGARSGKLSVLPIEITFGKEMPLPGLVEKPDGTKKLGGFKWLVEYRGDDGANVGFMIFTKHGIAMGDFNPDPKSGRPANGSEADVLNYIQEIARQMSAELDGAAVLASVIEELKTTKDEPVEVGMFVPMPGASPEQVRRIQEMNKRGGLGGMLQRARGD